MEALSAAEDWGDLELEAYALGQRGLARVYLGNLEQGLADLDEAMAVATSLDDPLVSADNACSLMKAAELIGDMTAFDNWAPLIERYMRQRHMPLVASCGTCCGEVFAATGSVESAAVVTDRDTGRSRGFGFVEMATPEDAEAAISKLNGTSVDGRTIQVERAKSTGGGGGDRRGGGGGRGGSRW